jgi:hypothetical protein
VIWLLAVAENKRTFAGNVKNAELESALEEK